MMLQSPRWPSLRWLDELLRHGIEVHGQVVDPDINDGLILEDTLCTIYERYLSLKFKRCALGGQTFT